MQRNAFLPTYGEPKEHHAVSPWASMLMNVTKDKT